MGFGFNLAFIFIIIPGLALLFIIWLTGKKIAGKLILYIIAGVIGLVMVSAILRFFTSKTVLDKDDYYGTYVIDRSYFSGKQANWQYNSFRFEIKENDSIYFYHTDGEKILKVYNGIISTVEPYNSARLVIKMNKPTHHIIEGNPTTYRSAWSFYFVFNSEKFNNVFFKKGEWKPLE
ncbi:hypothetical protein AM493_18040 [Flavobacterium akiainvivens]|uniref:Uncharacterized protein n=1 Tax=Flavobacterium akiainvivens TaxID=1202724 RepID=A0A0M8MD79_9FLAO|nr:hypothetical protein [Flavobacterium akiainvivens]KOS07735.1 hypothetical protein AM493_18040 [Flavobacterium akiainvivens]SFQ25267.1 hypothetical protein SAMN05444144_102189 [Flavobacterium akiainvivens]